MDRQQTTAAEAGRRIDDAPIWSRVAYRLRDIDGLIGLDGTCHAILFQLTSGAFLTGYALALGASPAVIGLLASLPLLVKLSQLYTSWRGERHGAWKHSAVQSGVFHRGTLLGAAVLPFVPMSNEARLLVLTLVLAVSSVAGSVYELAFITWMAELIPPSVRAAFFARRNRLMGFVGLVSSLVAAFALDRWEGAVGGGPTRDPRPFGVLFGVGAIVGLIGLVVLRSVPAPRRAASRSAGPTLRQALTGPISDENFRHLVAFGAAWGFGIGLVSPFFTVVMLQELRLSFLAVTVLAAVSTLAGTASATYWGRLADHFGAKTVLRASTYLITLVPLLWLFVSGTRTWILVPLHLFSGLAGSAFENTVNMLVLEVSPAPARPSYLANFGASYATTQAVGPIVGGLLVTVMAANSPGLMPKLFPYYVLFVIAAIVRAMATPLLASVHEPEATSVGHLLRVMGRFRSMSSPIPLDPLFRGGYTHLARLADVIARERPAEARAGADASGR